MSASVLYTNFGGMIVKEDRGGVEREYIPDTLGSTSVMIGSTGKVTDRFDYWPYGEIASRTGNTPTPFTWVGTLGYYKDSATRFYVRMRSYLANSGGWMTVDPLWPDEKAYAYVNGRSSDAADPQGLSPACVAFGICAGLLVLGLILSCLRFIRNPGLFLCCLIKKLLSNAVAIAALVLCAAALALCVGFAVASWIQRLLNGGGAPGLTVQTGGALGRPGGVAAGVAVAGGAAASGGRRGVDHCECGMRYAACEAKCGAQFVFWQQIGTISRYQNGRALGCCKDWCGAQSARCHNGLPPEPCSFDCEPYAAPLF